MAIEILPINGFIGAEIRGADLSRLDDAMFGVLHDALVRYEVIVLREQRITLEQQMAFGARFGPLSVHPFSPNMPDKPEVIVLDYSEDHPASRTDIWHADETFRDNPPMGTMLRARVIPDRGGDTCFASMTAAYRGLSERMKAHIHGLEALHDFKPFRTLFNNTAAHRKRLRELEDEFPNPWHPVVRVHPVSGRRAIYVNPQFTIRIRDLKEDESQALLAFLYAQASVPEYQLRVKWQPDTVVMWDNRSVQHYAPHDYYPQRRTMERVTITGDKPVGVTGAYTPETVEGLGMPNPKGPAKKPPVRQFERNL
jgi:taurine dioxygenase